MIYDGGDALCSTQTSFPPPEPTVELDWARARINEWNFRLRSISSYRCEDHPIEAAKPTPGQHAYGTAWDSDPYVPRSARSTRASAGGGTPLADANLVSHLAVRHAGPANATASSPQQLAEIEDS